MSTKIALDLIRTDGGTQPRSFINPHVVDDYAEDMQSGVEFEPVIVFRDSEGNAWLADGYHRVSAAKKANLSDILADVRQGTKRDAILYSVGANARHGLRRSNDDKRRAVMTLLNDDEWKSWSDSEIARRCAVDHKTVASIRGAILGISQDSPERTVTRNGSTYQQKTTNIGKGKRTEVRTDIPGYQGVQVTTITPAPSKPKQTAAPQPEPEPENETYFADETEEIIPEWHSLNDLVQYLLDNRHYLSTDPVIDRWIDTAELLSGRLASKRREEAGEPCDARR